MMNPHLEVMLAAVIWGSAGAFVKYLQLPPTTMAFFRLAIPTIILFLYFQIKKTNVFRGNPKPLLAASAINAVRMFFYFVGFTYASIGNAVIMLYTWPIFTTLLAITYLKEKISRRQAALLLISFTGIILMYLNKQIAFSDKDFIGMTSMLICAAMTAVTMVIFKKELEKYTRFETTFYQTLVGGFVFLPFLFINQPLPTLHQSAVASIYAILIGIVGFSLFFSALKKIKASTASTLSYIEVVSGVALGILLFKETLSWNMIAGGLLIIGSTMLMAKTPAPED